MDVTAPGRELARSFAALGQMTGKTLGEIVAVVGPPNSRAGMAHNTILCQWHANGYHIALLFDAQDRFIQVTSEYCNVEPNKSLVEPEPVSMSIGAILSVLTAIIAGILVLLSHC
jgi:hypothetical protein